MRLNEAAFEAVPSACFVFELGVVLVFVFLVPLVTWKATKSKKRRSALLKEKLKVVRHAFFRICVSSRAKAGKTNVGLAVRAWKAVPR